MCYLNNKKKWALLLILFAGFLYTRNIEAHSGHDHSADNPTISLPDIVAQVNGVNIPGKYVWQQLKEVVQQNKARGKPLSVSEEKTEAKRLMEGQIERELLLQKGKELGLRASTELIERRLTMIKSSFKSEKGFQKKLNEQEMTLDQFKKEVGMDLLMEALVEKEINPHIRISLDELKKFYKQNKQMFLGNEQVRASVILIKVDPKGGVVAEQKADEIIRRIIKQVRNGQDFSAMAKKYSEDSLALRGGDLGFFTKKRMFAPFSERAFKMKVGEVSDVFKTGHGYQILKVTDKKPGRYNAFEKVKMKIEKIVKRKKISNKTKEYVSALRQKAEVKVYY